MCSPILAQAVVPAEFRFATQHGVFLAPREEDGDAVLVEVAPLRPRRHLIANRTLESINQQRWLFYFKVGFFIVYTVCDSLGSVFVGHKFD